ncbi:uncharacterized protein At1g51745-like isoform X1 [Selaginella moellendorffii]|uniref:uncharacterized protein At1g51745-like isoform X1 n=1 Tax=Selaginella moellendorffii TaxID=88036 RepID=UPI000D1CF50C|nr:uncharacterized protein At1g51745-like isoform X1 [Selaginella moellendorffii]|eukprot:XP_024535029.1 uncharacterized protein At1g51745-like isoform X1 [Selaginella moellendorffii]
MPRMGGSSRDSYTNVDTAVGTIVWVRRRNGSWWPGRIISDSELSTANLLSPRSGTPVKLLGREDGSVDWYNIEKSKRVKPFRCGDFEECIEKAKAVAGLPTKKREKYARREDAILHALELERQQLECSSGFVESSAYRKREQYDGEREVSTVEGTRSRSRSRSRRKRVVKPIVSDDDTDSGNSRVYPEEDDNSGGLSSSGRGQEEQEWNPDEDEVEGLRRMRGLQDFGLRTAGRGRRSASVYDENIENHQSCVTQSGKGSTLNGIKVPSFTTKRKRTVAGGAGEEGSLRKRDRRRPLTQVLESSAKFLSGDGELMHIVDEDDALVEGNQAVGGLERMGVEFTSSVAEGCREDFSNNTTGVADRTCCSFSGHATGDCCDGSHPSEEVSLRGRFFFSNELFESARKGYETDHQRARRCLRKLREEGAAPRRILVKQEHDEGASGDTEQVTAKRPPSRLGQIKTEKETAWYQEEWLDVPVEKDSIVQKPSVPMVLLASKLTRRAVVGYPVVVEAIEGGTSDEEQDACFRQEGIAGSSSSRRKAKPPHKESLSKRLVKKVVASSRKTRTLSSIASEQRPSVHLQGTGIGVNNTGGGRAWNGREFEEENWPVAACVPVRVALSRIKAAVSGPLET